MKKVLPFLLTCLSAVLLRADLIWYEGFNYPDGPITNSSGGIWIKHSGSATPSDAMVRDNKLEVSTSGTGLARQDDVIRNFCIADCPYTNNPTVVYASFTINFTSLPTANGQYFAHFFVTNFVFQGRLWALTGNPSGTSNVFSALPGTYRLGVSALNSSSPSRIFPMDLATNTTYQVVLGWDPVSLFAATVWVNPVSAGDPSATSNDAVVTPGAATAFGFRQATGFGGFLTVSNLSVATTFEEAATNIWNLNPAAPVIVYQPQSATNFVGNPALLSAVAAGQGQGNLTYQWLRNGALHSNPDGNTNALTFPSAAASDSGAYQLIVTTPLGLSATSAVANLWITNPPVPPTISVHPTNRTVFFGQTAVFNVAATGPGTITYQWNRDGAPISGETNPTLTIPNVRTNNNTTGTYSCGVTNEFGGALSSNAVLSAVPAPSATIGYLRTLVDPVFFLPTNTTALWTVTGIVTTHTNITTAGNSSFYMQDDTGGINVFFAGSTARPAAGDNVTVTGPLGQFNSLLELNLTSSDPAHSIVTNSSGNLLPPGQVLPFSFTNGVEFGGVGESIRKFQSRVVTFTNVYFVNGGGTFAGGQNYTMTNQAGERLAFRVDSRVFDIIGKPIPTFAWTVTGPMGFFLNTGNANRSAGYQLLPTRYADVVTAEPPPASASVAVSGNNKRALTWDAVPYAHSYSILTSTNVAGPYAPQSTFQTTLLGTEEVAPNRSAAKGLSSVVLSPDQSTITVNASFSGLTAPATAGHIHGPAGPGTNTSVVFPFTGVPAATSGSMPEQSFAITPTQIGYLTNGLLYVNIHNTNFPGGEIRGQLTAVPSTGLTFATTNGAYVDLNAQGGQMFYRITSP